MNKNCPLGKNWKFVYQIGIALITPLIHANDVPKPLGSRVEFFLPDYLWTFLTEPAS